MRKIYFHSTLALHFSSSLVGRRARGPTSSLAVTLDAFSGTARGLSFSSAPTHTQRLAAVTSGLEPHPSAQRLRLPAASTPTSTGGEEAARGAGREAAPVSASSHAVGFEVPLRRALIHVYICTHAQTHAQRHWFTFVCQKGRFLAKHKYMMKEAKHHCLPRETASADCICENAERDILNSSGRYK